MKAAAAIGDADVRGADVGSSSLDFTPRVVRGGDHTFEIGTAGSTTLVAQTVIPALLTAPEPSTLRIEGGTHNPLAPPFEFLDACYLPLLRRLGPRVSAKLVKHGFFPRGGGRIEVRIDPTEELRPFDLLERGAPRTSEVKAIVAGLPRHIADREVRTVCEELGWPPLSALVEEARAPSKGNVVWARLDFENLSELCVAFGRLGVPTEEVAREVVAQVLRYQTHSAPVGEHLADQILLPLGLAVWRNGRQSGDDQAKATATFRTGPLSDHTRTHIELLRSFLEIAIQVEGDHTGEEIAIRIG